MSQIYYLFPSRFEKYGMSEQSIINLYLWINIIVTIQLLISIQFITSHFLDPQITISSYKNFNWVKLG